MPEKSEPGWAARARLSVVVLGQHAANDALLAVGAAQKEFTAARLEMKVLVEELKAGS